MSIPGKVFKLARLRYENRMFIMKLLKFLNIYLKTLKLFWLYMFQRDKFPKNCDILLFFKINAYYFFELF